MFACRVVTLLSLVAIVAPQLSCARDGGREIKDTERRTFVLKCPQGVCTIALQPTADASVDKPVTLRNSGRILGVCDGAGELPIDCRPLVCEIDSDCPVVDGVARTCTRSLCIDASKKLGRNDLVM